MSSALPVTTIISALAGAKARQYRQDAVLLGFAGLMAVLIAFALFGAFAVYVSESQGLVIGLLAAAGLALVLGAFAVGLRSFLRARALRRQRILASNAISALSLPMAATVVTRNKKMAIAAGLVIGLIAGSAARSNSN